jgi:hypothetical protein
MVMLVDSIHQSIDFFRRKHTVIIKVQPVEAGLAPGIHILNPQRVAFIDALDHVDSSLKNLAPASE